MTELDKNILFQDIVFFECISHTEYFYTASMLVFVLSSDRFGGYKFDWPKSTCPLSD